MNLSIRSRNARTKAVSSDPLPAEPAGAAPFAATVPFRKPARRPVLRWKRAPNLPSPAEALDAPASRPAEADIPDIPFADGEFGAGFEIASRQPGAKPHEVAFNRMHASLCARIDRNFAWLMLVQWFAAIAAALWISPLSWAGDSSYLHPHVALAILYGGVLTLVPFAMTRIAPGERSTRLTIAVTQMLMSSLLIHLTGGRIETHFHIFGSLALLAYYLDWQVLVTASAVIAIDHFLRGMFLPFSIFGTYNSQPWRWLEHTGWVVFCDIFLVIAAIGRLRDMRGYVASHEERGKLLHRAFHDSRTGLPNRSFLDERISTTIAQADSSGAALSCLYIDLDRFKEINDQLGHAYGDALLIQVAQRFRDRLPSDIFLARTRSDEFVALIPEPRPQSGSQADAGSRRAEAIARAIIRCLHLPFEVDGTPAVLGASIGISRYPTHVRDTDQAEAELLFKSDQAMFHVKRSGRNDYLVYSPEIFAESDHRAEAEGRLRSAIANREFRVFYQPIVLPTGELRNLEALVRWINPRPGKPNITPNEFIPLAEQSGLIVQLGNFVLHEACKQASDWRSRGLLPGRIAVNVSSIELAREDYAETAMLTLRQHYTPPDAIELEVTESALVQDFALVERHLRDLRAFGVSISIDDFGTGYSSLGRLRQLTLDTLKIDRLFIEGVVDSEADRTVVEHIIAMAHTLHMTVVAEGVETHEQLNVMRDLGCDLIQGYLFSRPQDMARTEAMLIDVHQSLDSCVSEAGKE